MSSLKDLLDQKARLRAEAESRRKELPDRAARSVSVLANLSAMREYAQAQTVLTFVSFGTEVATRPLLETLHSDGKEVVVPYCLESELHLFRWEQISDLSPGMWGILEPKRELRSQPSRAVTPGEIDLFIVPGLAFDRHGGRLGYGKGYFDRLLTRARGDAAIVAVGFDCQVFDHVPTLPHDVRMQWLATESGVHHCHHGLGT